MKPRRSQWTASATDYPAGPAGAHDITKLTVRGPNSASRSSCLRCFRIQKQVNKSNCLLAGSISLRILHCIKFQSPSSTYHILTHHLNHPRLHHLHQPPSVWITTPPRRQRHPSRDHSRTVKGPGEPQNQGQPRQASAPTETRSSNAASGTSSSSSSSPPSFP